jgi:hypothetical protein
MNPNWIPHAKVRAYIKKRTGTEISKWRMTHWINAGELRPVHVLRGKSRGWYVTRDSIEETIARYS